MLKLKDVDLVFLMTIKIIPLSAFYKKEKRQAISLFVGSCIAPIVITMLLVGSFFVVETRILFQSIPFIGCILLFYFTLFRILYFPPLFSGAVLRHETIFYMLWITVLALWVVDVCLNDGISLYATEAFRPLVPGVSQIALSNVTYFAGILVAILKIALTKNVKVELPWFSRSLSGMHDRNWGLALNSESLKKGMPLLIRNETDKVVTVTNIRLETFKDPPLIVPLRFLRRILLGRFQSSMKQDVIVDKGIILPKTIDAKSTELISIPWENFEQAYIALIKNMDWKRMDCPSVFAVFDEYLLESWISERVYVPHLLNVPLFADESVRKALKQRLEKLQKLLEDTEHDKGAKNDQTDAADKSSGLTH